MFRKTFLGIVLFNLIVWGAAIGVAVWAAPYAVSFFDGVVARIDHMIEYPGSQ